MSMTPPIQDAQQATPPAAPKDAAAPAAGLSLEWIIAQLSTVRRTQPVAALASANQHREALTEVFLQALQRAVRNPMENFARDGMLFNYASYFLSKWREPRAFPLFLEWFSLPGEEALELGGDTLVHDGGRFLASVCGGNIEPIQALIRNPSSHELCRAQALTALGVLAAWGEKSRDEVESYVGFLAREGLERRPGPLWLALALIAMRVEMIGLFPELRRACSDGLIPTRFMTLEDLEQVEKAPRGSVLALFQQRCPPITDVLSETRWWAGFHTSPEAGEPNLSRGKPGLPPGKVGRNDPCPCGSGKKFKKCCGA